MRILINPSDENTWNILKIIANIESVKEKKKVTNTG